MPITRAGETFDGYNHAENIAKGKMSAAYWADRVKW
jgi:hypothetical protein